MNLPELPPGYKWVPRLQEVHATEQMRAETPRAMPASHRTPTVAWRNPDGSVYICPLTQAQVIRIADNLNEKDAADLIAARLWLGEWE